MDAGNTTRQKGELDLSEAANLYIDKRPSLTIFSTSLRDGAFTVDASAEIADSKVETCNTEDGRYNSQGCNDFQLVIFFE